MSDPVRNAPAHAGTMLGGRFRIEKPLGAGGFGWVYLALDTHCDNRLVTIKDVILCRDESDEFRIKGLWRDFDIRNTFSAASVVSRVYDFIQDDRAAYIAMEYFRGKSLERVMELDRQPFPMADVVSWGMDLCDLLHEMHTHDPAWVFRGLQPCNIFLLEGTRSIRLIDFGSARRLDQIARLHPPKKTLVFSAGYAPPETRLEEYEPRSDLYSLAATLFHLATGQHPDDCEPRMRDQAKALVANPETSEQKEYRWFYELIRINLSENLDERMLSARAFQAVLRQRRLDPQIPCNGCQAPNPIRQLYCNRCGDCLTSMNLVCRSCGRNQAMGTHFCFYCGNLVLLGVRSADAP